MISRWQDPFPSSQLTLANFVGPLDLGNAIPPDALRPVACTQAACAAISTSQGESRFRRRHLGHVATAEQSALCVDNGQKPNVR
jgi:hypothetical protein